MSLQEALKEGFNNFFALGYFNEIIKMFSLPFVLALFFKDAIRNVINIIRSK